MSVTNPSPIQIADANWDIEPAIRGFTISIPTRPVDNDLAGIIVLAKAGSEQTLTFPDDVFYKGAWSDLIFVNTDANNNLLLPNQAYTVKVAAFDEFGTDSLTFSNAKETVTLQVVESDIADEAVTNNKIPDEEITSAKISGLVADKITAGTITGSTLQTSSTGKRFVVRADDEVVLYDEDSNSELTQLASIGTYGSKVIYQWPNNSTGDTDAIYTGGAQVKTTPTGGVYGVEFVSSGTVKVYIPDLVPGNSYQVSVITNSGTGQTINMGGANVNINTTGSYTVTCERAYFLISNTGSITTPKYVFVSSISRISGGAFSEGIFVSGSKNEDKVSFIGSSLNNPAIKAYSYGSSTVGTIDARNSGTGSGYSVLGLTSRGSFNGLAWGLYGYASISNYTGGDLLTSSVGVYGLASNGGSGVIGKSLKPFDDDILQNDCAAFKSLNGDCDFRNSIVYFKSYTVATLPLATIAGGMIYVSDESGGAVMAFSDGTNWRRVTDRAIVS